MAQKLRIINLTSQDQQVRTSTKRSVGVTRTVRAFGSPDTPGGTVGTRRVKQAVDEVVVVPARGRLDDLPAAMEATDDVANRVKHKIFKLERYDG